jgi:hypothetical protein
MPTGFTGWEALLAGLSGGLQGFGQEFARRKGEERTAELDIGSYKKKLGFQEAMEKALAQERERLARETYEANLAAQLGNQEKQRKIIEGALGEFQTALGGAKTDEERLASERRFEALYPGVNFPGVGDTQWKEIDFNAQMPTIPGFKFTRRGAPTEPVKAPLTPKEIAAQEEDDRQQQIMFWSNLIGSLYDSSGNLIPGNEDRLKFILENRDKLMGYTPPVKTATVKEKKYKADWSKILFPEHGGSYRPITPKTATGGPYRPTTPKTATAPEQFKVEIPEKLKSDYDTWLGDYVDSDENRKIFTDAQTGEPPK